VSRELIACLVAATVATSLVALGARSLRAGPRYWLARFMAPFFGIVSREYRGSYDGFSRGRTIKSQHWVLLWVFVFLVSFVAADLVLLGSRTI
jgi:hypothetical protein